MNDVELQGTQAYIHRLQNGLAAMRKTLSASDYETMSKQFLLEIEKKHAEIREYLTSAATTAEAA